VASPSIAETQYTISPGTLVLSYQSTRLYVLDDGDVKCNPFQNIIRSYLAYKFKKMLLKQQKYQNQLNKLWHLNQDLGLQYGSHYHTETEHETKGTLNIHGSNQRPFFLSISQCIAAETLNNELHTYHEFSIY
jgi:hypothetical protein